MIRKMLEVIWGLVVWLGGIWLAVWIIGAIWGNHGDQRLPDNIIENDMSAQFCADELESQKPGSWTTSQLRFCVDNLDGYTNPAGKVIHPFK